MAESKTLFLRNDQDVKAALLIVKSPAFEKLILFARAEFSERSPTREQSEGAKNFIAILSGLPDEEAAEPDWIESGLKHDLTVLSREPKTDNK
jgi:hypothetical protein